MSKLLTPNLSDPLLVLHKLEREMHRAFHNNNHIHKSDHFYNFCITALSLKDFVLIYLGKTGSAEKQIYYDEWASVSCLKAASEIANSAKHCLLTREVGTKSVTRCSSFISEMILNDESLEFDEEVRVVPDFKISMSDGTELQVYEFTHTVIDYWKSFFNLYGIKYLPQAESTFFGELDS